MTVAARPSTTRPARDEHIGHHRDVAVGHRVGHGHQGRRGPAQCVLLRLEPDGPGEPERLGGLGLRETDGLGAGSLALP